MKKRMRTLIRSLCLLLIVPLLLIPLSVSADVPDSPKDSLLESIEAIWAIDETLTDPNYSMEIKKILYDERALSHYSTANKQASLDLLNQVRPEIAVYKTMIEELEWTFRSDDNTAENKAKLRDLALRGLYAGTLAWIYHANTDSDIDQINLTVTVEYPSGDQYKITTDEMTVKDYYEHLIGEAIQKKPSGYFEARDEHAADAYFTWLFRAIYEAKLLLLAPDASLPEAQRANVEAALTHAVQDVRNCEYTAGIPHETADGSVLTDGEDGYNFDLIYAKAESALNVAEAVELLYPGKEFSELDATKDFLTALSGESDRSEINALLRDTLDGLLEGLQGENVTGNAYTYDYIDSLRASLEDKANATDAAKELIGKEALTDLFEDYPLKLEKAGAKDSLASYEAELLANGERYAEESAEKDGLHALIADAQNAVDEAADSDGIAMETKRGTAQAELYDLYLSAAEQIKDYVSDPSALLAEAEQEYTGIKDKLAAASSQTAMDAALNEARAILSNTVADAEAEAYLAAHNEILSSITEPFSSSLSVDDLPALTAALDATASDRMSAEAREKLTDQLTALGRAYRYVMGEKLRQTLANETLTPADPLFQTNETALRVLLDAVDGMRIDPANLSALKSALEEYLAEAEAIRDVIAHVTDVIRAEADYPSYEESIREQIHTLCDEAMMAILDKNRTDPPEALRDAAILAIDRREALGKIRLKANPHRHLTEVQELVAEVSDQILNEPQTADTLDALVADTSFRIDKLAALNSVRTTADDWQASVKDLKTYGFLTEEEVTELRNAIETVFMTVNPLVEAATTSDELAQQTEAALNALNAKHDEIVAYNEERAAFLKASESILLENAVTALKQKLEGLIYTTEEDREAFAAKADEFLAKHLTSIENAASLSSLQTDCREAYTRDLTELEKEMDQAEALALCLHEVREELNAVAVKELYSETNFAKLEATLAEAEALLAEANTEEEYRRIRVDTLAKLDKIPTLLREAQNDAVRDLNAAYDELVENSASYSDQSLAQIDSIYKQAVAAVNAYTDMAKIPEIVQLTSDQIAALRAIPVHTVFTEDRYLTNQNPAPTDYDPWSRGYYGSVSVTTGVAPSSTLSIYDALTNDIAQRIMQAAKERRIVDGNGVLLDKDVNRLLKKCSVVKGMDIVMTPVDGQTNTYRVWVLLPEGTSMDRVFGMVFLCEDGSAEYYEITTEGTLISFVTGHFSEYYVVRSETVNLIPLIVLLSLILAAEIAVLALLYLRRNRREQGKTILPAAALLNPYRPDGAWLAITLLGIAILVLAAWIVALLIAERRVARKAEEPASEEETEALPAPEPVPALPNREPAPVFPTRGPIFSLPEPIEVLPEVTVEEADELMNDETAEMLQYTEYEDPEIYTGTRHGEINVDIISQFFEEGDTVTLNSLKDKKLVPKNVGHLKVLGRGVLDKPLIIVAQSFSTSALKMILLTGGTPVVTKSAPRQGKKH